MTDNFKRGAVQSTVLLFSMKRFPGVGGSFIYTTVGEGGKVYLNFYSVDVITNNVEEIKLG